VALVVALVLPEGAETGGANRHRLSLAPRTRDASAAFAAGDPRAVQPPKWLVGRTEVSGRRRADSSSIESEAYCLSVSEKKREEYYQAIPQNCPAL
jgi:hypothetical protein